RHYDSNTADDSSVVHAPATCEIYTLSLHDALPISRGTNFTVVNLTRRVNGGQQGMHAPHWGTAGPCQGNLTEVLPDLLANMEYRSEEHTSELQSRENLVCRLLLEKKKESPRDGEVS